ncbi:hypothetical protein [Cardinium endosymbiont of Tipula unca]|uniref:TolB family protein n=1 Tax=Cardinium endosymbiont of Tipula unca TaxID=3066216 RepID=UPI0030CD5107
MAKEAQRMANTLETLHGPISRTLGVRPSPIRILLNNQSAHSNGAFTSLPRHILFYNFYSADPYFVGNVDWLSLLCIHEFRHAVQYSIQYHSTPLWLKPLYFFGNMIFAVGVPRFFSEGDAVSIETAFSKSGRGRLPGWEKAYKVNLLEREATTFAQGLFGSFQRELPDMYHVGYYFVTHIRNKYGAQAIKEIYKKNVRRVPYFGFYNAVKEVTQKSVAEVYKEMNQSLLHGWQQQLDGLKITPATHLSIKQGADGCDYMTPFIDASGHIMAWKKGLGIPHQLVVLSPISSPNNATLLQNVASPLKEKQLFTTCSTPHPPASFACAISEGSAAWLEQCLHPWRGKVGNNECIYRMRLQYYDFKRKKKKTLLANTRYNALAMSPSGSRLIAVESGKDGSNQLVVLETNSGRVIKKMANHEGGFYMTPSWSDENHVVVTKARDQQNSILLINIVTEKEEVLLPFSYEHRSSPQIYKDHLLYNSAYNGIDNIYAMHLSTKTCFQVTSRKYGAYLGMVDDKTNQLVFSGYTKNGIEIAVMAFDPLAWVPLEDVEDRSFRYYETVVAQEQHGDILSQLPNQIHPITDCSVFKDSLAFRGMSLDLHSGELKIVPFEVLNLEGNFKVSPYFHYRFNNQRNNVYRNKQKEIGLHLHYYTFYPIVTAHISTRKYTNHTVSGYMNIYGHNFKWSKSALVYWGSRFALGIELPYYFSLSNSSGKLSLATAAIVRPPDANGGVDYAQTYQFQIENSSTFCTRDIHSPWCQKFHLNIKDRVHYAKPHNGYLLQYASLEFFFPGIGRHHYLMLSPSCMRKCVSKKHAPVYSDETTFKKRISYGFPLAYPDGGIPYIIYIKMIGIEGYCNLQETTKQVKWMNTTHETSIDEHTLLGVRLFSLNNLFSISSFYYRAVLDFGFQKKKSCNWRFVFGTSFHLE